MKYSHKFDRMIDQIDSSSTTYKQRFALIDFQLQLEIDAPGEACYRCSHAEFFIHYFPDQKNGMNKWIATLGHCRAFMVLSRDDELVSGLRLPGAQFCTSFKAEEGQS